MNAPALIEAPVPGRVVRLIFIDEAGIGDPKVEPYTVVAGVVVHADDQLTPLEDSLRDLVRKHIPERHWGEFVFHAKELSNGGGKFFPREEWPIERRLEIARDLAALIARSPITIVIGEVERRVTQAFDFTTGEIKNEAIAAQAMAYTICALRCEHWMRTRNPKEVCLLIVEDNESARTAVKHVHRMHQDRSMMELAFSPQELGNYPVPFQKIKQDPLFQPKAPASVLQLADFGAYVMKKYFMKDQRYSEIFLSMVHRFYLGDDF